jgi:tetratricopeptide (TPR) repeat protein
VAADLAYESAFRGYDIDVLTLDPVVAAERVRASAIYESLVAALDHWLWLYAQSDASRRALLRRVADLADSDSWRVRFRDPTFLRDRAALEKLATQLDVATTSPTTVFILSRALLDVDAAPKAEEVLTAAQRRHPTDWWLNVQLAITLTKYASPPRFHDAATYARAALAIRPQAAASCTTLANPLQLSNLEESMSLFRRAIELDPDCRISYRALGDMHAGKTEWREAIDYYQQYLSGRTSPYTAASTHVSLANAYRATREPTKAKHELDNAREVLGKAARLKDALVVKDAVEAEALPVAETNCRAVPQWMRPWDAKKWSNGWQLYCSAKQGGFVEFELPALQSRVALAVCFTKAPDYAIVEVAVHGKVVGQSFDGYHPDVAPSGPINLGVLEQYSGAVKIRFTAIDKNPTSSHYRMGIDCLILTPVKGGNKGSQEDD